MGESMKFINKKNIIKIAYIYSALLFAIPSYYYILTNRTLNDPGFEFRFLFSNSNKEMQAIMYGAIITLMLGLYLIILKNRKELFNRFKDVFIYTLIFSSIFILIMPIFSHDVYYYMGIGRLNSQYKQNPYYISMKEYVENEPNKVDLTKDEVLKVGYKHYWGKSKVVYGPTWTLICAILSKLNFGNIEICFLIYKFANFTIHILNCYIIYKISKKKLFALIYGLNPFIIIESVVNAHNDVFMVFFILLAFYELLKKKSIIKSIIFLGIATSIKYFAILFLPFTIIYYYRKEKKGKRLLKCIEYGLIYIVIVAIPYCIYFRDLNVLYGIIEQQNKYCKSLGVLCIKYGYGQLKIPFKCLILYICYYIVNNSILLVKEEVKLGKEMRQLFYYLFIFTFVLVTNFQPWYIMWLMTLIVWQDPKKIRLVIQITIIALYGYIIFMVYGDTWKVGANYSLLLLTLISLCAFVNNLKTELKVKRRRGEIE